MEEIKIWLDDERSAPEGYIHCRDVPSAICYIYALDNYRGAVIKVIDLDDHAGFYAQFGGDYVELLKWLEEYGRRYPIHLHGEDENALVEMREIIKRNNWKEVS